MNGVSEQPHGGGVLLSFSMGKCDSPFDWGHTTSVQHILDLNADLGNSVSSNEYLVCLYYLPGTWAGGSHGSPVCMNSTAYCNLFKAVSPFDRQESQASLLKNGELGIPFVHPCHP